MFITLSSRRTDLPVSLSIRLPDYLYDREGWKNRHVPHGCRGLFSTIINGPRRSLPGTQRSLVVDLTLATRQRHARAGTHLKQVGLYGEACVADEGLGAAQAADQGQLLAPERHTCDEFALST